MKMQKEWVRKRLNSLRLEFGGSCRICGSRSHLEFAHLNPTPISGRNGRGQAERCFDILKNKKNYVLLCHDCHVGFDTGNLKVV